MLRVLKVVSGGVIAVLAMALGLALLGGYLELFMYLGRTYMGEEMYGFGVGMGLMIFTFGCAFTWVEFGREG